MIKKSGKLLWVDMGTNRSSTDCAVFNQSEIKDALENRTLGLPPPTALPGDDTPLEHFVIGDNFSHGGSG